MSPITIPQFLLPRGIPSARTLHTLTRRQPHHHHRNPSRSRTLSTTSTRYNASQDDTKHRVLEQPDKFRPPSHPARRVVQTRNGRVAGGPVNYPGPRLSEQEKEEKKTRQYPHMFPPEGTVMFNFLTSRWIHVWIAMVPPYPVSSVACMKLTEQGILTSLATFTFTTNFKNASPFAHLLPPWSALLTHPIDTTSQALSIYRMDKEHNSVLTREKRLQRVEDAEKRRKYRIAHGLEEDSRKAAAASEGAVDDQSPVREEVAGSKKEQGKDVFIDWEGNRKPVKKWFGIW